MNTLKCIVCAAAAAATLLVNHRAAAQSASEQLQQGLYAEEVEGNMTNAIQAYDAVVKSSSASRNEIAQALYRQATCYLKLKDDAAAKTSLQKLIADYSDQTNIVQKASAILDDLTDFDPAALMPPGTLAYVEFGSPGAQIETILTMLKGTPFENPLAAVGGREQRASANGKTPADMLGALLNPSMITEFKKIRSSAIGITGIAQNNPPAVAVLYPGKSDALRGLVIGLLGMGGTPGDSIEGMQRVNFNVPNGGAAAAYDDRVVIAAMPASQLEWCVKQYKGLASEPSLASTKAFSRLSKMQRQKNAITVWANVDEVYGKLQGIFPQGGAPRPLQLGNALIDFQNVDDLTLAAQVEPDGFSVNADLVLKKDHRCLVYDLIHTPSIGTGPLRGVPDDAVALASLSLSQADSMRQAQAAAAIKSLTGLDVGRELFANIEQVTLFVLPGGENAEANSPMYFANRMGLALTSHNPEQTREVFRTLLGTASTVTSGVESKADATQFTIGRNGQLSCYMEQTGGITILSLNRDVVNAAVAAIQNQKSVCDSGPLMRPVRQLNSSSSKLVLVNGGGAIRLLAPQAKVGPVSDAQRQSLDESFEQLARAATNANLELRTDEQQDELVVNLSATGIPPLNAVLQPMINIQRILQDAHREAAIRQARSRAPAEISPADSAPVMDGQVDAAWNAAKSYPLEKVFFSPADSNNRATANYRALWDATNLYFLVSVKDNTLHNQPSADWFNNDSVEIYIDASNSKSTEYGPTDYQYTFNWDKASPEMGETKHHQTNDVEYALVTTGDGYRVEVKFPWKTLGTSPAAGALIGLDVQVNDNQGGHERAAKIAWSGSRDDAWQHPQAFGNARLESAPTATASGDNGGTQKTAAANE